MRKILQKLSFSQLFHIGSVLVWKKEPNLSESMPWLPWPVIEWFEQNLTPDMTIFEWGSGGSALFFAKRVKNVITVEHEAEWSMLRRIYAKLSRLSNITFLWIPFETGKPTSRYSSTHVKHAGEDYENYCRVIEDFPNDHFDIILIDGRARVGCIYEAQHKIKVGGCIIVDDSERIQYQTALEALDEFERIDFGGTGPHLFNPHQTSIFRRKI